MALYLMGDIQGCAGPLEHLLDKIGFSASRDHMVVLGDMVNRGPGSLAVLRLLRSLGASAQSLLGNHDLHLLGVAHGDRKAGRKDTLSAVLGAPDRAELLEWLRHQHMALHRRVGDGDLLMVHAGVVPQWSVADTIARAAELQAVLRGPDYGDFLRVMYGNEPARWDEHLGAEARLRVIVNALTRLRFCSVDGSMEFETKDGTGESPPGYMPWFDVPGRKTRGATVAFGHWSTLGWVSRPDLISTDTGCVWGGKLTAVRIGATLAERERIQVKCPQAQKPG
ncbi:MAG: symmetrical bis(5'-nucleosyl)-tetraphosphatase [Proteobacteria bacterium]|nr:symmetrical bis(5'-nucleosyl)-tetraphosphatase [Pseudomonadota bacterium]